jgi:hypothetical protein
VLYAEASFIMQNCLWDQVQAGERYKSAVLSLDKVLNAFNAVYSSSRAGTLSTEQRNVRGGSAAAYD